MPPRDPKPLHHIGFNHAFDGLKFAFNSHPNFKIHLIISTLILFLSIILHVSNIEFIILLFCITLGFAVEMINTAIESAVNLITQEWRQSAKEAKDASSGAMLLTAIGTSLIGLIILGPKLIAFISCQLLMVNC